MTTDPHAQANADQIRLLREALAVDLSPAPEAAVPGEMLPAPETPAPDVAAEASP